MYQLVLVGLVAPTALRSLPTLARLFTEEAGVYWAFVLRQSQDFPVPTTFTATGYGRDGTSVTNRYRLVAVGQQYDALWEEVPHGWNTICAFQLLGPGPGLVADLPLVSGWYEQRACTLVLTAEQAVR